MSGQGNRLEGVAGSQPEMPDTWSRVEVMEVGRIQEQVQPVDILENPAAQDNSAGSVNDRQT